jgi:hypothetical protein
MTRGRRRGRVGIARACRLEIQVGRDHVTAVEDERNASIRRGIYTSAYPLATRIALSEAFDTPTLEEFLDSVEPTKLRRARVWVEQWRQYD